MGWKKSHTSAYLPICYVGWKKISVLGSNINVSAANMGLEGEGKKPRGNKFQWINSYYN